MQLNHSQTPRFERYPRLTLAIAIVAVAALLVVLSEIVARFAFPKITFMHTSAGLFVHNVYGDTFALAKNAQGMSFDAEVFTDRFGFRIDPSSSQHVAADAPSIIFLGDSVVFGVGVPARSTFVELLATDLPYFRVLNAAVPGYDFKDYKNFVKTFVRAHQQDLRIQYLVLGICLNDLSSASKANINAAHALPTSGLDRLVRPIHRYFPDLDHYLRERSKLYLLIKGSTLDVQRFVYLTDAALYRNLDAVITASRELDELITDLYAAHMRMVTVIFPYEFQLRQDKSDNLYPQAVLRRYFAQHHIPTIDLYEAFMSDMKKEQTVSTDYYLFADTMHFSMLGHARLHEFLSSELPKMLRSD
jgi:lysophospholipase L1-like esterase